MRIDLRARAASATAALALRPAAGPPGDAPLIPQRRRGPVEWLRYRLARPARDRQEERDATDFLERVKATEPRSYRIRQRDLPSASRRIDTVLLADGERAPWPTAPYAPDPEDESQEPAQDGPRDESQEWAQEDRQAPLPELRAWSPGDPGKTPTGVLQKITPEVARQLRPYLDGLPRYQDDPGQ